MEILRHTLSAHFAFHCLTDRIWGSNVSSSETKLRLYNCMVVTHLKYACQTWTLSSHINDRLEVAHNCFLRKLKGVEFSSDLIISTADLHKFHLPTVPMAFSLARQIASFIGTMIRTRHPSNSVSAALYMLSRSGFQR
eukprot:353607-Chlamydomonas_euryale.AAC.4